MDAMRGNRLMGAEVGKEL